MRNLEGINRKVIKCALRAREGQRYSAFDDVEKVRANADSGVKLDGQIKRAD